MVKEIFDDYVNGLSVCSIAKKLNNKNALNRNWRTTTIDRMLSNYIYCGDYLYGKRAKNTEPIHLEDVCPAIIDKETFKMVQTQKERNLKNYTRKHTYVYMQKIVCSKCHKIMGGSSSTSKDNTKHIYYKCACCKTRINEKRIEKSLMNFLNDMLDFFLIIDNSFKPTINIDVENDIRKYEEIKKELDTKISRIKSAFIEGFIEVSTLQNELSTLEKELQVVESKLTELNEIKTNSEYKQDIKTIFNDKEIINEFIPKIINEYYKKLLLESNQNSNTFNDKNS